MSLHSNWEGGPFALRVMYPNLPATSTGASPRKAKRRCKTGLNCEFAIGLINAMLVSVRDSEAFRKSLQNRICRMTKLRSRRCTGLFHLL
jgi:hypothetical protein